MAIEIAAKAFWTALDEYREFLSFMADAREAVTARLLKGP